MEWLKRLQCLPNRYFFFIANFYHNKIKKSRNSSEDPPSSRHAVVGENGVLKAQDGRLRGSPSWFISEHAPLKAVRFEFNVEGEGDSRRESIDCIKLYEKGPSGHSMPGRP